MDDANPDHQLAEAFLDALWEQGFRLVLELTEAQREAWLRNALSEGENGTVLGERIRGLCAFWEETLRHFDALAPPQQERWIQEASARGTIEESFAEHLKELHLRRHSSASEEGNGTHRDRG